MNFPIVKRIHGHFLMICLLSLLNVSVFAQSELYSSYQNELLSNLDGDDPEANLELIKGLLDNPLWSSLSCDEKGRLLHLIGLTHYYLDDEYTAISYFEKAINGAWKNCPTISDSEVANTRFNIGVSYQYTPEIRKAKPYLDQAIYSLERDSAYPEMELAYKYQWAGDYYSYIKDFHRSKSYLNQAQRIFRKDSNSISDLFQVNNQLLILALEFEDFDEAIRYANLNQEILVQFPELNSEFDLAQFYLNTTVAYIESNRFQEALSTHSLASEYIESQNTDQFANSLEYLGMIKKRKGESRKALELFEKVELLRRDAVTIQQRSKAISLCLENQSSVLFDLGENDKALELINRSITVLEPGIQIENDGSPKLVNWLVDHHVDLIRQLQLKGRYLLANQTKEEKIINLYHKVDTLIQNALTDYDQELSQFEFLKVVSEAYSQAIEHTITFFHRENRISYLEEAFYFSGIAKAAILQHQLDESRHLQLHADKKLLDQETNLRNQISLLKEQLDRYPDSSSIFSAYVKSQSEYALLQTKLAAEFGHLDYIELPDIDAIQSFIGKRQLVLDFYMLPEKKGYCFWITRHQFFVTEINKAALDSCIAKYASVLRDPSIPLNKEYGKQIYNILLADGFQRIHSPIAAITVIPNGSIHRIPLEVSVDPETDHFLIHEFSFSRSYQMALQQHIPKDMSDASFLGFATSYSADFSERLAASGYYESNEPLAQLTVSTDELLTAASYFTARNFVNQNASVQAFKDYSSSADLIYLSLHGLVNYNDPSKSCIVFDDRSNDFILSSADLFSQSIQANLVVLSACHSASGTVFKGEGIVGMTRSFLSCGARNIVSSMWSASEQTSMNILPGFISRIQKNKENTQSLKKAKIEYLNSVSPQLKHPYYWANYQIVSSGIPIISHTAILKQTALWLLGLLLIASSASIWYFRFNKRFR